MAPCMPFRRPGNRTGVCTNQVEYGPRDRSPRARRKTVVPTPIRQTANRNAIRFARSACVRLCVKSERSVTSGPSGAPRDRPRKTVTDSARSGPRPISLVRPPEFAVCLLMCEIRAFPMITSRPCRNALRVVPLSPRYSTISCEACDTRNGCVRWLAHFVLVLG